MGGLPLDRFLSVQKSERTYPAQFQCWRLPLSSYLAHQDGYALPDGSSGHVAQQLVAVMAAAAFQVQDVDAVLPHGQGVLAHVEREAQQAVLLLLVQYVDGLLPHVSNSRSMNKTRESLGL